MNHINQNDAMTLFSAFYRVQLHDVAQLMSWEECREFRKDPVRFYRLADDDLQNALWKVVEEKMPKRKMVLVAYAAE